MSQQQTQTTESVSFRLPRDLLQRLHFHAKQSDLTMSQVLRRILKSYEPVASAPTPTETPEPKQPSQWLPDNNNKKKE